MLNVKHPQLECEAKILRLLQGGGIFLINTCLFKINKIKKLVYQKFIGLVKKEIFLF